MSVGSSNGGGAAAATVADVLRNDARWCVVEGDSAEVLRDLPDGSVDAVITDPPYDERTHREAPVDINFAALSSFEFVGHMLRVARRWSVAFCAVEQIGEYAAASGDSWVRAGAWDRVNGCPQFSGDRPAQGFEGIAIMHKPTRKRWNGGGKRGVWRCGVERGEGRAHPTQKPVRLMLDLVRDFTDAGEVILDPFGGSGTTGVAALAEGRRVIIVERDPAYAAIARARCEAAATGCDWRRPEQGSLFGGAR